MARPRRRLSDSAPPARPAAEAPRPIATPDADSARAIFAPVIFTIVANNYFAYARTLMQSVADHHPGSARFIVLCDEVAAGMDYSAQATVVRARDLGIAEFAAMAFHYDVMEFSTAIKPPSFRWLAGRHPGSPIIYLDPDILVTAPLVHVQAALEAGASLVLTPHITAPLQDGAQPDDLAIMKSGIYNLGFAAFSMTDESMEFLQWWQARCRRDAIVDIADNKFTDQRWMDLAPALVRRTTILHHPAYNLAYWNLVHRRVRQAGSSITVEGEPLRFVHFSGVTPGDRSRFSKHQDRFTPETLGDLRGVFDRYIDLLLAHGWERSRTVPYAYNAFANGRPIHPAMRAAYRAQPEAFTADPAAQDGAEFDEAAPPPRPGHPPLTHVMAQLHRRRQDLAAAFDTGTPGGRRAYLDWFTGGGGTEAGCDALSVEAARALAGPPPVPPWPPQGLTVFQGPRTAVVAWLLEPVPLNVITDAAGVRLPRVLALLWESRPDLNRHFSCQTAEQIEQYLAWCITDGAAEGSVPIALAAPAMAGFLDAAESMPDGASPPGAGPPVTRLMRLMAGRYDGPFPHAVQGFPASAAGRMALVLWLAGPASRHWGWPPAFCQSLLGWLKRRAAVDPSAGPLLPNLLLALWSLRDDVRSRFDIATTLGRLQLLAWTVHFGLRETGLPIGALSDESARFVRAEVPPAPPGFRRFHHLALLAYPGLQATLEGQAGGDAGGWTQLLVDHLATDAGEWGARAWLEPPAAKAGRNVPGGRQVLLTGLPSEMSGRAEDIRMTAASLAAHGVAYGTLDRKSGAWSGAEAGHDINVVHHNADTALQDFLFLDAKQAGAAYTIGYWAWELAALPAEHAAACAYYDEIWASTTFAYDAIRRSSRRPVLLMPMAVTAPSIDPALRRADFGLPEHTVLFYFGFDFSSYAARKNPEAAVQAFRLAFPRGDEPAGLLIKSMGAGKHPAQYQALMQATGGDPRILVRDRRYTAQELATLVSLCDVFLSLHRSEGFGRGPAEAMLLGKPVIATGYSGNLDFMHPGNCFLVRHRLVPVQEGEYPGWQGQVWADADLAHAAELMRSLAGDPGLAARIGQLGRQTIQDGFSPHVAGARYRDRIAEIRGDLPHAPRERAGARGRPSAKAKSPMPLQP